MRYRELLQQGVRRLQEANCLDPELDAWYLFSCVFSMDRTKYLLQMEEIAEANLQEEYEKKIEIRASHVPLQYITGVQEFMGLEFQVTEDVLIPRQDTELLVEETLKIISDVSKDRIQIEGAKGTSTSILDMCTGSGCILISILSMQQDCKGVGVDISEGALVVAKTNATNHDVMKRSQWICSDLFEHVEGTFDFIVSNPPYIATKELQTLMPEVIAHEPVGALDGLEDGLFFYRKIIEQAKEYLNPGGNVLFEIGYDQGVAVKNLMEEAGFQEVIVMKDYCKNDRVVKGHL